MSDTDPPPTQRTCPACGFSGGAIGCKICDGSGLATPRQVQAWLARQRTRQTSSSTKSIPFQAQEALTALRRRGTAQTAPLIAIGEGLLKRLTWDPLDEDALTKMSEWLTAVQGLLRGER